MLNAESVTLIRRILRVKGGRKFHNMDGKHRLDLLVIVCIPATKSGRHISFLFFADCKSMHLKVSSTLYIVLTAKNQIS